MTIAPLARIESTATFHRDYFLQARPVVVTGGARELPAFDRWTDDYLRDRLGSTRATVRLADERLAWMQFADFLEYLACPERYASSHGPVYLTDFYVRPTFGDPRRDALGEEARCPLPLDRVHAEWISLYAGPAYTSTPMHQDVFGTHTWLAELRGRKTWRVCPPETFAEGAGADAFGASDPAFEVYEAVLEPGDVIYLPPDWWHQVRNESATLAVSGNFCSFEAARSALDEVLRADDGPYRDVWSRTWSAILESEPAPR